MNEPVWKQFFDTHAPHYMENVYVTATEAEIAFIANEFGLNGGERILDVGCGVGRHSVPLAKMGCKVTGVDLSEGMLSEARKFAESEGVGVEWVRADAAQFRADGLFDAAICLCEGSFGLLGEGDDPYTRDLTVLKNVAASLKSGGRFILNALSASRNYRRFTAEDVAAGEFDPISQTDCVVMELDGKTFTLRERSFTAPELVLMCRIAGFDEVQVYGGTAGNWGKRTLDLDEYELMAICRKR